MANNILFVFEGEKTEDQITRSMRKFFLTENTVITCAYCNNLYNLYKKIEIDDDLDTFALLKAIEKNQSILADFDRSDFAEIFLFFDYDGHDTVADDDKIRRMLELFNEETEKGKLFISYPMVESLKHLNHSVDFQGLTVECKVNIRYKSMVNIECDGNLVRFSHYELSTWKRLIIEHLKKMNYLVECEFEWPIRLIGQNEIFTSQLSRYINPHSRVAVLNSFPVFLHDYYGNTTLHEIIYASEI